MKIMHRFRSQADRYFPFLARYYRLLRDYWKFYSYKPYATIFGFSLYGDPEFDTSRTQSGEMEILKNYLTSETVLIDVGANVGLFSCYAGSLGCHAIAIEPNPLNFKLLCRNLYCNKIKNVEVLCMALSDTCEIKSLFGGGQGASLLANWGGMQSTYSNLVPVTTLDHIAAGKHKQPLFIKIDVEGNEFAVLKGATETLSRHDCVWMIENGLTQNFKDKNPHYKDIFDVFWSYAYQCYCLALKKFIVAGDIDTWIHQGTAGEENIDFFFFHPDNNKF